MQNPGHTTPPRSSRLDCLDPSPGSRVAGRVPAHRGLRRTPNETSAYDRELLYVLSDPTQSRGAHSARAMALTSPKWRSLRITPLPRKTTWCASRVP